MREVFWARETTVDTAGARCASHRKGQAPSEDWLRQYFYPHGTEVFSSPPYARHRVPSPKPLSERSQNPKAWGNWEGIGDFCLQKCQRGRQLSPLSEATRLVSAATPRAVFLNLVTVNRFLITAKRASLLLRVEFGDRRIGKANRRKGQRELLSRRVKLPFRRWLDSRGTVGTY